MIFDPILEDKNMAYLAMKGVANSPLLAWLDAPVVDRDDKNRFGIPKASICDNSLDIILPPLRTRQ
jgi:hypothetical protein